MTMETAATLAPPVRSAVRKRRKWWPWVLGASAVLVAAVAAIKVRGGGGKPLDASLIVSARRGDLAIDVIETSAADLTTLLR